MNHTIRWGRASLTGSTLRLAALGLVPGLVGCQDADVGVSAERVVEPPSLMRVRSQRMAPAGSSRAESKAPPAGKPDETGGDVKAARRPKPSEPAVEPAKDSSRTPPSDWAAAPATLRVARLIATQEIVEREPVPLTGAADLDKPMVAFAEVSSGPGSDRVVEVVFEHESGKRVGFVKLVVPASQKRWRTWARTKRVSLAGTWSAKLLDDRGNELAQTTFSTLKASEPDGARASAD